MPYAKVTDNVFTSSFSSVTCASEVEPVTTSNVTCIGLPNELVFVDCGLSSKFAARFRKDMEAKFQRKTSHLLLTHLHRDHYWAMGAFKDVDVVASRKELSYVKRILKDPESRKRQWARRIVGNKAIAEAITSANLFLPTIRVREKLMLGSDNEVVFQVAGGHSAGSAYVYSPSERVLCTGDNLLTCYAQLVGDGERMLETYRHWETLDIDHVVPGHGGVVSKAYITKVRSYFEELISTLKELKDSNLDLKSILKHPDLPVYFGRNHASWIEGSPYHTGWLNNSVGYWYKKLAKEESSDWSSPQKK
ncbi:MAG: MBL fold metallo-hydrolase [Candidatus Bathyarchaeota archaeon]|nr:MBL fold metallo-hydrolase [Candidatus Bathyarchaeota archaeon]